MLGIPVACTWGALDLMNHDDPLMAGGFGTHGTRAANFTVQNADLILALGSRLDTKATGTPSHFAREAKVCMVDIDQAEIDKFQKLNLKVIGINQDVGTFLSGKESWWVIDRDWSKQVQKWKKQYPVPTTKPYLLMQELGKWTTPDDIIVTDTGCAVGWVCQGFPFKGERLIHAWNMTPMGYGLPAAIGASLATGKRVLLITGDGSSLMSLGELATLARWKLPVKIVLLDNQGHAMCRQTQRQWLGGEYVSTSLEGGLGFPNWTKCAESFGIPSLWVNDDYPVVMDHRVFPMLNREGPVFLQADIDPDEGITPQAKYGQPIEDADPQLPWEELKRNMIIPPLERT